MVYFRAAVKWQNKNVLLKCAVQPMDTPVWLFEQEHRTTVVAVLWQVTPVIPLLLSFGMCHVQCCCYYSLVSNTSGAVVTVIWSVLHPAPLLSFDKLEHPVSVVTILWPVTPPLQSLLFFGQ